MKHGTIIKNNWAGERNPSKYFVYTGVKGNYATGMYIDNGKLEVAKFYKRDVMFDRVNFEIVGDCDYVKFIKEAIEKVKEVNK